jgi:hypothetical protein
VNAYWETLSVDGTEEFIRHTAVTVLGYACCEGCARRAIVKTMGALDVYSFAVAAFETWGSSRERLSCQF